MDLNKISNLIKNKRKEKGLTQEELAQRLNVTEKAISRWETGRGTPDISLLIPLAKELKIEVLICLFVLLALECSDINKDNISLNNSKFIKLFCVFFSK